MRVVLARRAMPVRRLCCGSNISSLGWVGSFERVDMSSVPWKTLCLVASVVCFVVGISGVEIISHQRITVIEQMNLFSKTGTGDLPELNDRLGTLNSIYELSGFIFLCSPLFAYLFIFLNRRKEPTSHNRLN